MLSKQSIILGIDPGSRVTGYGVISIDEKKKYHLLDYGCIRPPQNQTIEKKYMFIFNGLCQLIDQFTPGTISVETQFVYKNPQSAMKLGMVRGIVLLAAALREILVVEYSPARAKKSVVGRGNASKGQVQTMMRHLFGLNHTPEPEDAADALALAICHGNTLRCTNI